MTSFIFLVLCVCVCSFGYFVLMFVSRTEIEREMGFYSVYSKYFDMLSELKECLFEAYGHVVAYVSVRFNNIIKLSVDYCIFTFLFRQKQCVF